MRRALLVPLLLLVVATGCRTTHDATDEELASLGVVGDGLFSAQDAGADLGESSAAATSGIYATFIGLRKDADGGGGGSAGLYIVNEGREPWPDCVTEVDNGVEYNECEFSASGNSASVEFFLDGYYYYSDSSAEADLTYDFGVAADDISVGWTSNWSTDRSWSDTVLDGEYHVDYAYGITTGNLPTIGGIEFTLDGTIEALTYDEACPGIVSGVLDWRYTYKETGEPPENGHVTIEWIGCDDATVTW